MSGVPASSHQAVLTTSATLTNAQIKALPTTPIALIPAPGAGLVIVPLVVVANKSFAAAAYTNVGVNAANMLAFRLSTNTSSTFQVGVVTESNYAVFGAATVEQFPIPLGGYEDGTGVSFPPGGADLRNLGLYITVVNLNGAGTPLGDYTGGNAANTLSVSVFYLVVTV